MCLEHYIIIFVQNLFLQSLKYKINITLDKICPDFHPLIFDQNNI